MLPLLHEYLQQHCGPPLTQPDYPSATWFTHEGNVLKVIADADVEEGGSEAESDAGGRERTQSTPPPPPPRSFSESEPDPSAEENRRSRQAITEGKKRAREESPVQSEDPQDSPDSPVRRSSRLKHTKDPANTDQVANPSSSKRRKSTAAPASKKLKLKGADDPLEGRLQLVYEVHQRFVRPSILLAKRKANDKIST